MEALRLFAFIGLVSVIILISLPYLFTKYHSKQIMMAVHERAQEVTQDPKLRDKEMTMTIEAVSLSKKVGRWDLQQNPAGNGFSILVRPVSQMICNYILTLPTRADVIHVNGVPYHKGKDKELCKQADDNVIMFFFGVSERGKRR